MTDPRVRRRRLALAAIVVLGLTCATLIQSFSWNQTSHYDLIRALNNGTTHIDAYKDNTGDKARYRGHYYSSRAPGLALYSLPFYDALLAIDAPAIARDMHAQRNDDELIWMIGLWGSVLPGLLIALLGWRVAERFEPGYGAVAAIAVGLGSLLLPLSTLLFSHVFAACLAFAAFALLLHERDGPPQLWILAVAGLLLGYGIASEYPVTFVTVVLGVYALARRDTLTPTGVLSRGLVLALAGVIGVIPLLLYNHYAFGSWTHLAYADIPRQKAGFFGIGTPSLRTVATLLFDSRGLLTLSPVLAMSAFGTVVMYRGGRRAEALVIAAIAFLFLIYNSGYFLPFGGGIMGPRFLTTLLPFLIVPVAVAFRRFPAPTIALAGASIATMAIATATHPLIGYETETVVWTRYLSQGFFQPTLASAFGAGRGWGAILPFFALAALAVVLAVAASERFALSLRALAGGLAALAGWALFAAIAPSALGIDTAGLKNIVKAGDNTALHKPWPHYPLTSLVLIAFGVGLASLLLAALLRNRDEPAGAARSRTARAREPSLSAAAS
jgi:hypothetical protein